MVYVVLSALMLITAHIMTYQPVTPPMANCVATEYFSAAGPD